MANGKAHERINLIFLAIGIVVSAALIHKDSTFEGIFVIVGFIIGTFLIGPDLDLRSRPYRRWRWLRFIWIPYQTFKHRSIWTHGYIIGDVIRYAYLSVWCLLLLVILSLVLKPTFGELLNTTTSYVIVHKTIFLSIFFGNVLSSAAHTLTDKTTSTFKKYF